MRDAGNPCSVLTKSPLLLRDLDLFKQINQRTEFSAALSVPTLDEKAWRSTEPHTPNPRARLGGRAPPGGDPPWSPWGPAHAGRERRPGAGPADPRNGRGGRSRLCDR